MSVLRKRLSLQCLPCGTVETSEHVGADDVGISSARLILVCVKEKEEKSVSVVSSCSLSCNFRVKYMEGIKFPRLE